MTKKLTELPAAASVASTDILAVVNLSDTTTRKATVSQLMPGVSSDGTTLAIATPNVRSTADTKVTPNTAPVHITTTGTTSTPLQAFSVGSTSGVVIVRSIVTASDATATNTGAWSVDLAYKNVGGTLTQLGTGGITAYGTPSGTLALTASVSAGTVTLNVVGVAATNIVWTSNGFQNVAVGA